LKQIYKLIKNAEMQFFGAKGKGLGAVFVFVIIVLNILISV